MKKKIGIFDSGIGGLSVLLEFLKRNTYHDYVYFGDTSRVPYGNKSETLIKKYSIQITEFLIKEKVDMIIVACGTATSVALDTLKAKFEIPIIGVIEPTTDYINKNNLENILLLGTYATIKSNSWQKLTTKNIYMKATPMFVPMIEEGISNEELINNIINYYLSEYKDIKIDNVILGCTHYPFITNYIKKYLNKVNIINMGTISSTIVDENKNNAGEIKLYFSDLNDTVEKFVKELLSEYKIVVKEKLL